MNDKYLPPRLLQLLGVALLIGSAIFWAVTSRESTLLMSSAMTLVLLGSYRGAIESIRSGKNGRDGS